MHCGIHEGFIKDSKTYLATFKQNATWLRVLTHHLVIVIASKDPFTVCYKKFSNNPMQLRYLAFCCYAALRKSDKCFTEGG